MKSIDRIRGFVAAVALLAPAAAAQTVGTLATVAGKVVDLTRHPNGSLVYCTDERDVGLVSTSGSVTLLATAATGRFPLALRGVVASPTGDVSVVDTTGDIYRLAGGALPAVRVYADLYMIFDPTDLLLDASGNYALASLTPSGVRALNWISADGAHWAYYVVQQSPIAIAGDPLTGKLLMADEAAGGALRLVDVADEAHSIAALETAVLPGFTAAALDGDLAPQVNGDVLYVAGGTVRRYERASASTALLASGLQPLHGIAIAASSGAVSSPSGWSAYVAEGNGPTAIREIGNVGAPASVIAPSLGLVPGPGKLVVNGFPINSFDLEVDRQGNLLIGGDVFGSGFGVFRISLPSLAFSTVATVFDGLAGQVNGLCAAPDGSIDALLFDGRIQRIAEGPLQVTTLFADPSNLIVEGKDLLLQRDGAFVVANRTGFGTGNVVRVAAGGGSAVALAPTHETRGVSADPFTAKILVTEWNDMGFAGSVGLLDGVSLGLAPIPGFAGMNYSNAGVWGDGDTVQDVAKNVYTCSEDDFSVYRFNRNTGKLARIGSGYLDHPTGLAIAQSSAGTASTTGWSLYVSEYFRLWEIANVAAPAPRIVDPQAPPAGRVSGFFSPALGAPRAMIADPAGGALLVSTAAGFLLRLNVATGAVTTLAGSAQGLSGDLIALAARTDGHILVASRAGVIFDVAPPGASSVTVLYANGGGILSDVRGLAVDGLGRPLLVDRPGGTKAARLYRLSGGALTLLAQSARGARPAVDPLTAEVFVTEEGWLPGEGGEVLRVDALAATPAAGHFRMSAPSYFRLGAFSGGIVFDAAGNFFVASGDDGRAERVARASGKRTTAAGNYEKPVAVALAPGTPGTAGPQGTSLFVLDGFVVFETGVTGLPAPPPPATNPGLAPPAELRVSGFATLGGSTPVSLTSPADANRTYVIVASLSGKIPGLPIALFGNPEDPRVLPNNPDSVWSYVNTSVMPSFYAALDAAGKSPAATAIVLPNDPSLLGLNSFVDLSWLTFDPSAINGVASVGGTAHFYLGN